jgi:ubiquinone biosynthesis protein
VLVASLGVPIGQIFAELDPEPAAAASIAQVHKARLRCAEGPDAEVAVKARASSGGFGEHRSQAYRP